MESNIKIDLRAPESLTLGISGDQPHNILLQHPAGGTKDYNRLINRPQINSVTLSGNQTPADLGLMSENTAAGWAVMPDYVPKAGEICLYSDAAKIKIGDGSAFIVDLPFIGEQDIQTLREALQRHMEDMTAHVAEREKEFWNNKLNYEVSGDTLVLNRN